MGIGDEIMAAGQAERLAKQAGKPVAILDKNGVPRWHEVWERNPYVDPKSDLTITNAPGARPYIQRWEGSTSVFNMDYVNHPGRLYLTQEHWDFAKQIDGPYIVAEPVVRRPSSLNKEWPMAYWHQLKFQYPVIQMGVKADKPILPGAIFIKTPTIFHAAAIIANSCYVITSEGGTHHVAGAMRKPAIVIYGSFTSPKLTGYPNHDAITVEKPNHPCGKFDHCATCKEAMLEITPKKVQKVIDTFATM